MQLAEGCRGSDRVRLRGAGEGAGARAQGKNIIHLEIGQPDFPTPAHVVRGGKKALDEGWTEYGPTPGFPDLREAIAAYISRTRGIKVGAENVFVVPGGKPIMFFAMIALLEPGDEVIYPNPAFPIYESMIRFLGAKPVPMPLVESRGFSFDLDTLADRLSPRTKMIDPELAGQPDRRRDPEGGSGRIADLLRERDLHGPERRDLLAHLLRGRAVVDRAVRRACWRRRSSSTASRRRTR